MNYFVRVRTKEQADVLAQILEQHPDKTAQIRAICPLTIDPDTANALKQKGVSIFADLPFVCRENIKASVLEDMNAAGWAEGYVVKNIDELGMLKSMEFSGDLIGDPFLYAYNSEAMSFLREYFPDFRFIAPDELNDDELKRLPENVIYKIYGRARVMLTAQSLADNYGINGKVSLKSARHDKFISLDEDYGYTAVYTADPVSMLDREVPWDNIMADLTTENARETAAALEALLGSGEAPSRIGRGHHFRGID